MRPERRIQVAIAAAIALILAIVPIMANIMAGPAQQPDDGGTTKSFRTVDTRHGPVTVPEDLARATGSCDLKYTHVSGPVTSHSVGTNTCAFAKVKVPQDVVAEMFATALVEITFASMQASAVELTSYVHAETCAGTGTPGCALAKDTGTTSPLRMLMDNATYLDFASDELYAVVFDRGAVVDQEFHVTVTLLPEGEAPEGIPAA